MDSLDTLVVLNDKAGFEDAVQKVIQWVSFDVNTKPQVFETNIRVLGGLLSAHIFANQTDQPFHLSWYQGELLAMSKDLGERLLRAFATPTGIPFARVCPLVLTRIGPHLVVQVDKPAEWPSTRREYRELSVCSATSLWPIILNLHNRYRRGRFPHPRVRHLKPSYGR